MTPVGLGITAENPLLETHTRTVAYESQPNEPVDVPGEFVSSRTVTSGNRTVETITVGWRIHFSYDVNVDLV